MTIFLVFIMLIIVHSMVLLRENATIFFTIAKDFNQINFTVRKFNLIFYSKLARN